MVFQKGKPRPPLRVKTCTICRKSYQPASGAQKTCGEAACKAEAKAQGMAKRRQRVEAVNVKEEVARVLEGGKLGDLGQSFYPSSEGGSSSRRERPRRGSLSNGRGDDLPDIEPVLTPLQTYIEALVRKVVREEIRAAVQEEIASRLRPLLER
jgi:hypothetical protein